MNIDELKKQESELMQMLDANRASQRLLNTVEFIKKHGFNIGDRVEWMDGKIKRVGVISGVEFMGQTVYYYNALLVNSDGNVGKRVMRLWPRSFETIKLIKTP